MRPVDHARSCSQIRARNSLSRPGNHSTERPGLVFTQKHFARHAPQMTGDSPGVVPRGPELARTKHRRRSSIIVAFRRGFEMGFDERHGSGNLRGQDLADAQADFGDIAVLDGAKDYLPGRFRPARKKHLPHQAADLFFAKAVRIPRNRFAHSRTTCGSATSVSKMSPASACSSKSGRVLIECLLLLHCISLKAAMQERVCPDTRRPHPASETQDSGSRRQKPGRC